MDNVEKNGERFSAQDLHYDNLLREFEIKKLYEKIADECFDKIKRADKQLSRDYTEYRIPFSIMGEKYYNFTECLCHVMFTLRKAGFYVRFFAPNKIYICWPNYEKNEKELKKIKFLKYEHYRSEELWKKNKTIRPIAKETHLLLQENPFNDDTLLLLKKPEMAVLLESDK
jgi:hypothetical protein